MNTPKLPDKDVYYNNGHMKKWKAKPDEASKKVTT